MFNLRSVMVVAASVLMLVAAAGTAHAQPGGRGGRGGMGGGMMEGMLPQIGSRQVDKFAKILALTSDQKEAAEALLEGYAGQAAAAAKAMRDASQRARDEFRETNDPAVFEKMQESTTKFRDERQKLDETFLSDLKSILTPEQEAKWPQVERTHRRDATLRWGRLSGERVDLVDLAEQQQLAPEVSTQVAPLLEQYQEELDRELTRRNEVYQGAMEKMMELRRTGDMEGMQDMVEKGREAGRRVRDVNRRFFRQMVEAMPEDKRAAFEAAFNQQSYPDIYRKGYASRVSEAATGMADLTPEQKEQLAAVAKRFAETLSPLQAKLVTATEESEAKFNLMDMMARGWNQEGPLADLREERRDLERKLIDDIRKVLTDEQETRLPERSEEDGDGRGRWGGGGGGGGGGRGRGGQN